MKLERVQFYPTAAQTALPREASVGQVQALLDRARNATDDDEERTLIVHGMDQVVITYEKKLTPVDILTRRVTELERENAALRAKLEERGD
jgi:polyhydroxyalkanoate synthesis regulator phasin